jgi:glycosyltransferase involved in cell wall biosynthesis
MLMEAFATLAPQGGIKLLLVGDGPLRRQLASQAREGVIFAGYHRGEDLAAHYASADLMVFPSLSETFGNVVLEAMAAGLPVVGYDAPGPRDIIQPGRTGFVVGNVSADALAHPVAKLLADPERRRGLGINARAYAETQTWPKINAVVRDVYQKVLAEQRAQEPTAAV